MKWTRIVTAAALSAGLAACGGSGSGSDDTDEGDGFGAEVMCEEFVKDRLKSPGSADFSEQTHQDKGPSTWTVTGVVDSENGFGALLRADYSCTMKYMGNDKWQGKKILVTPR